MQSRYFFTLTPPFLRIKRIEKIFKKNIKMGYNSLIIRSIFSIYKNHIIKSCKFKLIFQKHGLKYGLNRIKTFHLILLLYILFHYIKKYHDNEC